MSSTNRVLLYAILLLMAVLTLLSVPVLEGSGRDQGSLLGVLWGFAERFFPPDFSDFKLWIPSFIESLQMAWMATWLALIPAFFFAFCSSSWVPRGVQVVCLVVLSFLRAIPALIYALLAVAVFGPYPLAGVTALVFYSIGYLGKFFADDFNSLDLHLMNTYRAWGVPRWPAFRYGLWPQVSQRFWAHFLWMLEYNVRSSTIIGYVGAGGIGVHLIGYQEYAQWDRFMAVILLITVVVFLFEARRFFIRR